MHLGITIIHRLPSTALKTMSSLFLTPIIQIENAHFPIQILYTRCSARKALGILLLSFLVFRKETIPVFPPSHLWNTAFQLPPHLTPHPHLAPYSPTLMVGTVGLVWMSPGHHVALRSRFDCWVNPHRGDQLRGTVWRIELALTEQLIVGWIWTAVTRLTPEKGRRWEKCGVFFFGGGGDLFSHDCFI